MIKYSLMVHFNVIYIHLVHYEVSCQNSNSNESYRIAVFLRGASYVQF